MVHTTSQKTNLNIPSWIEGYYTELYWIVQDNKIYVCNTPGIQTGTFEDNLDKWDILTSYDSTDADFRNDLGISEYSNMEILDKNTLHHMDTKEQILWTDEILILWGEI